jgi:threonine synthase
MENKKFYLKCKRCGFKIKNFTEWFKMKQKCPECNGVEADVIYFDGYDKLKKLLKDKAFQPTSLWGYFDFLPLLDEKNIVSNGMEGIVPIERWTFLETYARENHNLRIKVYSHRHDRNVSTGTFKDLAGTVVASVLKENNIHNYVAASTGNIGVAFSCYLAAAGINLYIFIPKNSVKAQEAELGTYGQNVFRIDGDYHVAKNMAKEFAEKNNYVLTGGNFDPMRLEAKKTMLYEWIRKLPEIPTVFMQAISGGSGPLGVAKAYGELDGLGLFEKMPRFLLPQPHRCAPMAEAWQKAKANQFPKGWEFNYPVIENPYTTIETLSTGNPTAYPSMAKIVQQSDGEIFSVIEERTVDAARLVAYYTNTLIGPAAAVTVAGFFKALNDKYFREGDVVMLNIGEGTRRSPQFVEKLSYTLKNIKELNEINIKERKELEAQLWEAVK